MHTSLQSIQTSLNLSLFFFFVGLYSLIPSADFSSLKLSWFIQHHRVNTINARRRQSLLSFTNSIMWLSLVCHILVNEKTKKTKNTPLTAQQLPLKASVVVWIMGQNKTVTLTPNMCLFWVIMRTSVSGALTFAGLKPLDQWVLSFMTMSQFLLRAPSSSTHAGYLFVIPASLSLTTAITQSSHTTTVVNLVKSTQIILN